MSESSTSPQKTESNPAMTAIGYVIAAGVFLLLLPVLPVVAVLLVLYRVIGGDRRGAG